MEAFIVAWNKRDASRSSVKLPWLLGIARKLCANHLRRRQRFDRALERLSVDRSVHHDADLTFDDPGLLGALSELSFQDKEILVLVAWEELSVAEISRVLGCSRATAAVRLHRARKRAGALLDGLVPRVSQTEESV